MLPLYQSQHIAFEGELIVGSEQDVGEYDDYEDDRPVGVASYISELVGFLKTALEIANKNTNAFLKNSVQHWSPYLVECLQWPREDIAAFERHPENLFVVGDISYGQENPVRFSTGRLMVEFERIFGAFAMEHMLAAIVQRFQQAIQQPNSPWKNQEACLYAIGILTPQLKAIFHNKPDQLSKLLDMERFSEQLAQLFESTSEPYLKSQILQCASGLMEMLTTEKQEPFVSLMVKSTSSSQPMSLSSGAYRAIRRIRQNPRLQHLIQPHGKAIIVQLAELSTICQADLIDVVLGQLVELVTLKEEVAYATIPHVFPILTQHWEAHMNTLIIISVIQRVFEEYATFPCCLGLLWQWFSKPIARMLQDTKLTIRYPNHCI